MDGKIRWLRISYRVGAIVDGIAAILMLFPELFISFSKINLVPDTGFRFGMRFGAPLMIGWTVLLIWADRKPVERKSVLLITIFPVIAGFTVFWAATIAAGLNSIGNALPSLALEAALTALFGFSYLNASGIDRTVSQRRSMGSESYTQS